MSDLRKKLIKLAHDNPKLRPDILPLLTKKANFINHLNEVGDQAEDFERVLKQFEKSIGWLLRYKDIVPPVKLGIQVAQQKMKKVNKEMHEVRELLMGL